MPNNHFRISYIIVIISVGALAFYLGFTHYNKRIPITAYQVYLDGEIIGIVDDEESLEKYINQKEESIKKKYGVSKVYMPNGVTIKEVTTYNKKLDSNEKIYQKLIHKKQFTIKGTIISIKEKNTDKGKTKYI